MGKQSTFKKEYSFSKGDKNVYGNYVHATVIRRDRWIWIRGFLVCAGMVALCSWYLCHPDWLAEMRETGRTHRARSRAALMPFVAPVGLLLFTYYALLFGIPLLKVGCNAFNYAYPKFYGWRCSKNKNAKFLSLHKAYFSSFERYAMEAVVGEKSVCITEVDGSKRTFALRHARRAYRQHGLVILESGPVDLPTSDVILDVSGMSRQERREFFRFLDSHLPAKCKCYYWRRGKPSEETTAVKKARRKKASSSASEVREEGLEGIDEACEPSAPTVSRLPIGSVVKLEGHGERTFMVYGRKPVDEQGVTRDYLLCAYPEGRRFEEDLDVTWYADAYEISEIVFQGYLNARGEEFEDFLETDGEDRSWDL